MQQGLGAIGEAVVEAIENAELAAHVVGGLGLAPERRAAQHQGAIRILQQVGEVRGAAGELADRQRPLQVLQLPLEIGIHTHGIQLLALADLAGLVGQ